MLYKQGDIVFWGKYRGVIRFVYNSDKPMYAVTLFKYKGWNQIDRCIDQNQLIRDEQICIESRN